MTFLQAEAGQGSMFVSLLPLLAVFAVFYFVMLRPQQQQQKRRREMLGELKRGDQVITVGGIHGEITAVEENDVMVRISEKLEVKVTRAGIGRVKGDD